MFKSRNRLTTIPLAKQLPIDTLYWYKQPHRFILIAAVVNFHLLFRDKLDRKRDCLKLTSALVQWTSAAPCSQGFRFHFQPIMSSLLTSECVRSCAQSESLSESGVCTHAVNVCFKYLIIVSRGWCHIFREEWATTISPVQHRKRNGFNHSLHFFDSH